jgi:membrane-bound lytic murein transglycosylase D
MARNSNFSKSLKKALKTGGLFVCFRNTIKLLGFFVFVLAAVLPLFPQAPDPVGIQEAPPFEISTANAAVIDFPRPLRKTAGENPPEWLIKGEELTLPSRIYGLNKPLTKGYIERYSSKGGKEWLTGIMKNAAPYIAFIRQEIEKRDIPAELLYVPVIESGFLNKARSKSGAVGMWQFMRNSMEPFDMRVTEWLDERMDFWKSTIGALEKFKENYNMLNDWSMAIAAYNMGLNGVNKAIKQAGSKDYWEISEKKIFKVETIHYIPKLLAVSYILTHPRQFGMIPLWHTDPEWTRVKIGKTVDLGLLAKAAGVDASVLKSANQELFFTVTPPNKDYYLKVPADYADKISAALARTDISFINYYFYMVKSGDTLSALARHYGVTVDQIQQSNPGVYPNTLKIGAQLIIPAYKDVEPYKRNDKAGNAKKTDVPFTQNYTVKNGETLWAIALRYKVDPEQLADENNMQLNDTLRAGSTLKVPIN